MNVMSSIPEITAESFEQRVLRSELPVLIAVYANGSRASEKLLLLLETWTLKTRGWLTVLRINAAESPELVHRCGVPSVPGLALFHQRAVCYQFSGELSRRELEDLLTRANLLAQTATTLASRTLSPPSESK